MNTARHQFLTGASLNDRVLLKGLSCSTVYRVVLYCALNELGGGMAVHFPALSPSPYGAAIHDRWETPQREVSYFCAVAGNSQAVAWEKQFE